MDQKSTNQPEGHPVSVEGLRDYLDAVGPALENDGSLKANLYALALAHELDQQMKKKK